MTPGSRYVMLVVMINRAKFSFNPCYIRARFSKFDKQRIVERISHLLCYRYLRRNTFISRNDNERAFWKLEPTLRHPVHFKDNGIVGIYIRLIEKCSHRSNRLQSA